MKKFCLDKYEKRGDEKDEMAFCSWAVVTLTGFYPLEDEKNAGLEEEGGPKKMKLCKPA